MADKAENKNVISSIEIDASPEGVRCGVDFVNDVLKHRNIADTISTETELLFEELLYSIIDQIEDRDTKITIASLSKYGDIRIRTGYDGKVFVPPDDDEHMLAKYADKVDYTYHACRNNIFVYVKRNFGSTFKACLTAAAIAVLLFAALRISGAGTAEDVLIKCIVYPIQLLFTNAMLMLAAPVTFFSLLKNLTDSHILATNESGLRRLQWMSIINSVVVIIMAIALSFAVRCIWNANIKVLEGYSSILVSESPLDVINGIIPSSIIEPFETMSPFPLIFVAALTTAAFCSSGKYFDAMKKAADVCYELFSRMLSIVMTVLPIALGAAVLDILCNNEKTVVHDLVWFVVLIFLSPVLLWLLGIIKLKASGIPAQDFYRGITGMIRENLRINSSIDAVPYNVRYCSEVFGMDRKRIERPLSFLSQINMEGNCFLLALTAMLMLIINRSDFSYMNVAVIAVLVLFLSLGAPNQPGGLMIGLVVIFDYMSAQELLPLAIFCEVLFGGLLNLINVIGNMVMLAKYEKDKGGGKR